MCDPELTHDSLDPTMSMAYPQRHLDRFLRFSRLTGVTNGHADRATCEVISNSPHLCSQYVRCGLEAVSDAAE